MHDKFTAILLFSGAFISIGLVIVSALLLPQHELLFGFTTTSAGGFTGAYFTYINSRTKEPKE